MLSFRTLQQQQKEHIIMMAAIGAAAADPLDRGGSNGVQQLSSVEKQSNNITVESTPRLSRRKLPEERQSITHKFSIGGHEGYITVGMYEDGTAGEIFITVMNPTAKAGGLLKPQFMTSLLLRSKESGHLQMRASLQLCQTLAMLPQRGIRRRLVPQVSSSDRGEANITSARERRSFKAT